VHDTDDEAWYVLEGRLRVRLDGDEVEAGPGDVAFAPPGTVHTFWNPAPGRTRYLALMTPEIAALIRELHAPGTTDRAAVFRRHDSRLLA